jgi:type III secretion system FlhB-like substrate exporter
MMDAPKKVVGLRYEPGQGLPQVILKGAGPLAEEILQRRGAGRKPPIVKNEALLEQLYRLPIDCEIGPELYRVVAIILVHVFAVEEAMKGEQK